MVEVYYSSGFRFGPKLLPQEEQMLGDQSYFMIEFFRDDDFDQRDHELNACFSLCEMLSELETLLIC